MADAIVSFVVERIGDLLIEEAQFLYGVSDQVENIQTELKQMRSFLKDADSKASKRDESIEELVKHLVDNEKNCRKVSICGMGGVGKTTLAKKVYHRGEVRRRFDYLAWSCMSQQSKARDVWEGILIELTNEQRDKIVKLRNEELAKKLYEVLQTGRCLVIIDDILEHSSLGYSLIDAFPCEETSSLILLTTRNKDVALHADPTGFHYEPR